MRGGKLALLVIGVLLALVGASLLAAGGGLTWAYATQRDDDGYFTRSDVRLETPTAAMHSESIDLGTEEGPGSWFVDRDIARVRLVADAGERPMFIGIARTADVDAYLKPVAHDLVADIDDDDDDVTYERQGEGTATLTPPADEDIWVASANGSGVQSLTWDLEAGRWSVVLMNADARPGVDAMVSAGVRLRYVVPAIIVLFAVGAALLGIAAVLLVVATRHERVAAPQGTVQPAMSPGPSAIRLTGRLDEPLSRGLWLVKWFLAVPHLIVLAFLWVAFLLLTVVAGFAILFTGRYPRGIFDFNVGVLRWTWRATYYATSGIGTDRYPPFSLQPSDYPATLDIAYPEHLSRGLVLVKWWLLAIPHYIVVGLLAGGGAFAIGDDNGRFTFGVGLIGILTIVAGVIVLFRGHYPRPLHGLIVGLARWVYRVMAYAALMTDEYPPFRLDQGADEPVAAAVAG
jgi:hypothetical protein